MAFTLCRGVKLAHDILLWISQKALVLNGVLLESREYRNSLEHPDEMPNIHINKYKSQNITPELIAKIIPSSLNSSKNKRADFYLRSYPALLEIVHNKTLDVETRMIQLACATYGWMPTIPKNVFHEFQMDMFAAVKTHEEALRYITEMAKPIVNNSWVGTSKVLHFINPSHFPIWDSRITQSLCEKDDKTINANNKSRYLKYCELVHEWDEESPDYGAPLAKAIEAQYKYRPTNLRCIELVLFSIKN